ncbi:conserved hypothetical protein [Burkholderia vietnamiensis]|nr:conserved hypothetical protein [Burkholderia vietnamiensis]
MLLHAFFSLVVCHVWEPGGVRPARTRRGIDRLRALSGTHLTGGCRAAFNSLSAYRHATVMQLT